MRDGDRACGKTLGLVATVGPSPAANSAEEVQPARLQIEVRDFDSSRVIPGHAIAAAQDDDVVPIQRLAWMQNLEWHFIHFHDTEFRKEQRFIPALARRVNPLRAVRRGDAAQINETILLVLATNIDRKST